MGWETSYFIALCTGDFLGCGEETRLPGGFLQTQHLLLWLHHLPFSPPLTLPFLCVAWTWPAQIRPTQGGYRQEKEGQLRARGDAGQGTLEDQLGKGDWRAESGFSAVKGGGTRGPLEDLTSLGPSYVAATGALSTLGWIGLT